jgi:hypothetical protein
MFKMVLQRRLVEFLGLQGVITGRYRFRSGYSMAIAIQDMVQRARSYEIVEMPHSGSLKTSRRHWISWITGSS